MNNGGTVELHVSLDGMDPEDGLRIQLPLPAAGTSLTNFLDQVFPEDQKQQQEVTSLLDLRANPDLPEIYDAILDAFNEWRSGRSTLSFLDNSNQPLDLADPVTKLLQPDPEKPPFRKGGLGGFHLRIHRHYQPMEYAIQQGFWDTKAELLEWLQTHTLLYFMDKHELSPQPSHASGVEQAILPIAQLLQAQELIALSQETNTFAIRPFQAEDQATDQRQNRGVTGGPAQPDGDTSPGAPLAGHKIGHGDQMVRLEGMAQAQDKPKARCRGGDLV